jgi:hypothetical protein
MEIRIAEGVVVSIEFLLALFELAVLLILLVHMKRMRDHGEIERKELQQLHKLHSELKEALHLLKEDIRELNKNQAEMHALLKTLK